MRNALGCAGVVVTILLSGAAAVAGPWEDGMVAYNGGDYMPAVRLFRPLAQAGNAKAQNVMGVMYRKGEGVARNSAKAFMWFSLAANKGDPRRKSACRKCRRK
jgi:TPR repeat protein